MQSNKKGLIQVPSLISIKSAVQVPHVESHDSSIQLFPSQSTLNYPNRFTDKQVRPVSKKVLQYAGQGLVFSPEVVFERVPSFRDGTDMLKSCYSSGSLLPLQTSNKSSRHLNVKKKTRKAPPPSQPPKLPERNAVSWTKGKEMKVTETTWVKNNGGVYVKSKSISSDIDNAKSSHTHELKGCRSRIKGAKSFIEGMEFRWDEAVLQNVSHETASHIVMQNVTKSNEKARLEKMINRLFGQKMDSSTQEQTAPGDDNNNMEKKKKVENDRLKLVRKREEERRLRDDPFLNASLSAYYKLPRYMKKHGPKAIDYSGANRTCENIEFESVEAVTTTMNLQDFFSSKVNNTVLPTDNDFEIKMLTGDVTQLHNADGNRIKMSDNSEFQLQLQPVYPQDRVECFGANEAPPARNIKGRLRWSSKPTQLDKQSGCNRPKEDEVASVDVDLSKSARLVENQPLVYAVESWRTTWKMSNNWHELKLADIVIDLQSCHDVVRFAAMATCVAASLYSIPGGKDIASFGDVMRKKSAADVWSDSIDDIYSDQATDTQQQGGGRKRTGGKNVGHLPPVLISKAREKLDDECMRVQLAAAMCLHACGLGDDLTLSKLEYHLEYGLESDQIVAAQLIALRGEPKAKVVQQMVNLLVEGDDDAEQATALLVHLSQYTRLVHSLLAEQLNNSNWKVRSLVCDVLGKVKGKINRDLVNKLKKMMWQDWNPEVRRAAARVMGRTGNGRAIHYELRNKLACGSEREAVEGLKTIAHINIMTASLLSRFIKCFSSDYMTVRIEACLTASKLKMKNETIIAELISLIEREYSWKVKAHAIKAISYIGLVTDDVIATLLHRIHFDKKAAVRLEACHALHMLKCKRPDVIEMFKERLEVEDSVLVKEEMKSCLRAFGIEIGNRANDSEMVLIIKKKVEKICSKEATYNKIMLYEREQERLEIEREIIGNRPLSTFPPDDDMRPDSEIVRAMKAKTPNSSASSRYIGSGMSTMGVEKTPLIMVVEDSNDEDEFYDEPVGKNEESASLERTENKSPNKENPNETDQENVAEK